MHNLVYKTINLINGREYVGSHITENLNDGYLGTGKLILRAIKKYGKENFKREILKDCESEKEARNEEENFIKLEKTLIPNGYNINPTGQSGFTGRKHSKKTKALISKINRIKLKDPKIRKKISENSKKQIGPKNSMYGKKQDTAKMKQRWIDFQHPWIGKNHTDKSKQKMSLSHQGKELSEEHKNNISLASKGENNGMYGRKHSAESLEKMRQKKLGKKWTDEMKQKVSDKNKGRKFTEEEKEKRKKHCKYCGKFVDIGNLKRWHNDNCKENKKY